MEPGKPLVSAYPSCPGRRGGRRVRRSLLDIGGRSRQMELGVWDGLATCVLLIGVHAVGGGGRRSGAKTTRYQHLPPLELQPRRGPFSNFTDGRQHGPCDLSVPDVM